MWMCFWWCLSGLCQLDTGSEADMEAAIDPLLCHYQGPIGTLLKQGNLYGPDPTEVMGQDMFSGRCLSMFSHSWSACCLSYYLTVLSSCLISPSSVLYSLLMRSHSCYIFFSRSHGIKCCANVETSVLPIAFAKHFCHAFAYLFLPPSLPFSQDLLLTWTSGPCVSTPTAAASAAPRRGTTFPARPALAIPTTTWPLVSSCSCPVPVCQEHCTHQTMVVPIWRTKTAVITGGRDPLPTGSWVSVCLIFFITCPISLCVTFWVTCRCLGSMTCYLVRPLPGGWLWLRSMTETIWKITGFYKLWVARTDKNWEVYPCLKCASQFKHPLHSDVFGMLKR